MKRYAAYRFPEIAAKHNGSVYMRFPRGTVEHIYDSSTEFNVGGAHLVKDDGKHLTIVAHGYMVSKALKAGEDLKERGIDVSVVDAYSIKPLGWDVIEKAAVKTNERILFLLKKKKWAWIIGLVYLIVALIYSILLLLSTKSITIGTILNVLLTIFLVVLIYYHTRKDVESYYSQV